MDSASTGWCFEPGQALEFKIAYYRWLSWLSTRCTPPSSCWCSRASSTNRRKRKKATFGAACSSNRTSTVYWTDSMSLWCKSRPSMTLQTKSPSRTSLGSKCCVLCTNASNLSSNCRRCWRQTSFCHPNLAKVRWTLTNSLKMNCCPRRYSVTKILMKTTWTNQ